MRKGEVEGERRVKGVRLLSYQGEGREERGRSEIERVRRT